MNFQTLNLLTQTHLIIKDQKVRMIILHRHLPIREELVIQGIQIHRQLQVTLVFLLNQKKKLIRLKHWVPFGY